MLGGLIEPLYIVNVYSFLAGLSPLLFVAIRGAIKGQRQEIVKDLANVFEISGHSHAKLIPSFEFVKYKYFIGEDIVKRQKKGVITNKISSSVESENRYRPDYSIISWIIGTLPLCFLVFMAVFIVLNLLLIVVLGQFSSGFRENSAETLALLESNKSSLWIWGTCAAFAGGYVTTARSLLRAISNFDLSPATMIGETIKLLTSIILGPILAVAPIILASDAISNIPKIENLHMSGFLLSIVIISCFVAGIMPDVVVRSIIQRDKLKNFKMEESSVYKAFKITPVEIIDGIDSGVRARLEDHHIYSTQNLAAANPLMLFVETPYGVYQIMDWVAQAQLCCSVGRDRVINLWPLGIRTLFDLERLALNKKNRNDILLIEVGRVMLGDDIISKDISIREAIIRAIITTIELRLDDPHVQRLRQIYMAVGDRLGHESRRLPFYEFNQNRNQSCSSFSATAFLNKDTGGRSPAIWKK